MPNMSADELRVYYRLRYTANNEVQRIARRERGKVWLESNDHKARASTHNRTLRHRYPNKVFDMPNNVLAGWLKEQDGKVCTYCGDSNPRHIDHRTPLSRDGKHDLGNLQLICRACNHAKHDMLEEEFLGWAKNLASKMNF